VGDTTKRILLVEDHDDVREVTAMVLRGAGYDVAVAGTKAEAIRLCKEQTFSLLLGDIGLPDGNGYDLMRDLAKICNIKGIAFTGYGREADVINARTAGYSAHLVKPVDLDILIETVGKLLQELQTQPS
jgi:CheY-like chemotaxis protein